jgi:hypothetical protein
VRPHTRKPMRPNFGKATLIRLGIRGFNPKLRHAEQRLETLRAPEGEPIPANTAASSLPARSAVVGVHQARRARRALHLEALDAAEMPLRSASPIATRRRAASACSRSTMRPSILDHALGVVVRERRTRQ